MPEYVTRGRHPADPTGESMGDAHWPLPDRYYGEPKMQVAFDRASLTVIGVGEYRVVWAKAIGQYPSEQIVIGLVESGTTYSKFTEMELKILYRNITGQDHPSQDFEVLYKAVREVIQTIEPMALPPELMAKPPHRPRVEPALPIGIPPVAREKPLAPTKAPPGPANRPKAGTSTGQVWDLADELATEGVDFTTKAFRQQLMEKCSAAGINPATAQVQYGKWKGSKKAR